MDIFVGAVQINCKITRVACKSTIAVANLKKETVIIFAIDMQWLRFTMESHFTHIDL